MAETKLSLQWLEEFASNVQRAVRSGQMPVEGMERTLLVLAGMVISLAQTCAVQRELNEAMRESADALQLVLDHLAKTQPKKIPKA